MLGGKYVLAYNLCGWDYHMARIEKTVFISYRRKDISWALAVYQYLTSQKYDVFFDYTNIPSGDFEQIIISNIRARAHFILILTPTTLDRCSDPNDWVRREIETAMDEKRNIVPLFFDGFSFGLPNVTEKLTGRLADVKRYNGLDIPSGYFPEAMERLRVRYLNVPLSAVLHPVPTEVKKVVRNEKSAANKALHEQQKDIQELVKPIKSDSQLPRTNKKQAEPQSMLPSKENSQPVSSMPQRRLPVISKSLQPWFRVVVTVIFLLVFGLYGVNFVIKNAYKEISPSPTQTDEVIVISTSTLTKPIPTNPVTIPPFTPTPTLGIGSTMTGIDGMTLLYVPAGEFIMGSEDSGDDEKPVHTVYINAFWIDQTEVTNALYAMCVKAGVCDEPSSKTSRTRNNYYGKSEFDDYPVIYVSWNDASTYCSWADRRLPTEAEWEKAARGENAFTYPWGNTQLSNNLLNYSVVVGDTTEVGSYPDGASPYGALDMVGNVAEWVYDWYDSNYYQSSPSSNPQGPSSGQYRVLRGGSVGTTYDGVRSADRDRGNPTITYNSFGFRCAMDVSE